MAVNFTGISSGIDTAAIIKATLEAQRAPLRQLETRKSSYTARISDLGAIASKLDELESLASDMGKTSNVLAFQLAVGDADVIGATADGEPSAGSYDLAVTQLARAEKDRSVSFASALSEVKAGTLTLHTAGSIAAPYTISIDVGDTLEDVVDKINASGARVDASIIRDSTRAFLQIVASDSGHVIGGSADDAITISESYTGQSGGELGLTQVVQAQNALLTIDGLAAETRTNRPTDLLPGVALELARPGESTLSIATDKGGTREKLEAFVAKANELLDLVKGATRTSEGARRIESDPTIERIGTELRALVGKTVIGAGGASVSLAQIGIETDAGGHLAIDSRKLDDALAKDIRGVGYLFTRADSGLSASIQALAKRYTDGAGGVIGERKKALNRSLEQLDTQMERLEGRLARVQATLQKQFTAMEKAMQQFESQASALSSLYFSR